MGAFEKYTTPEVEPTVHDNHTGCPDPKPDPKRVIDECVIAQKVYDSCRRQVCLTVDDIGEALAEEPVVIDDVEIPAGGSLFAPRDAVAVSMDCIKIKSITIDKQPSPFRIGYWDVSLKYVITYKLIFRTANGGDGLVVKAMSIHDAKVTMFGSVSSDLTVVTDMYQSDNSPILTDAPYCWAEAKAIGLDARIVQGMSHRQINVTIGLFSILKLFHFVHLNVQSKGFCTPGVCKEVGNIDPCKYFNKLDFPVDVFTPPPSMAAM